VPRDSQTTQSTTPNAHVHTVSLYDKEAKSPEVLAATKARKISVD